MTKIEWTDETWNPIVGCSLVSPGCTNCYAMRMARRFDRPGSHYDGTTMVVNGKPVWTGKIGLAPAGHIRSAPLRWRKPRRIFVNSMSDLFHEAVPDAVIGDVWDVMSRARQHIFQILTKRPERMRAYCGARAAVNLDTLPNVWLGTSIEDQTRADERIPCLLSTPAAVRFLSVEPLLGPVDLSRLGLWLCKHWKSEHSLSSAPWCPDDPSKWWWEPQALRGPAQAMLDWIIVGGESGPGARPMHPDWARSIRDQCQAAGVPFFFKQWGEWKPWAPGDSNAEVSHVSARDGVRFSEPAGIRQPGGPRTDTAPMSHTGKKAAGRVLSGRTWDEYPE